MYKFLNTLYIKNLYMKKYKIVYEDLNKCN